MLHETKPYQYYSENPYKDDSLSLPNLKRGDYKTKNSFITITEDILVSLIFPIALYLHTYHLLNNLTSFSQNRELIKSRFEWKCSKTAFKSKHHFLFNFNSIS